MIFRAVPLLLAGLGSPAFAQSYPTSGPCWCTITNFMGAGKYTYSLEASGVPIVHVAGPLTPTADCPAWSSGTYRFDGREEQPITLGTGYFRDIEVPPLFPEGKHAMTIQCWGTNVGGGSEFHEKRMDVVVDNTVPSMGIAKPSNRAILPAKAGSVTYEGMISDNNENPGVALYQFVWWTTTPDRIYPFPYAGRTSSETWSLQFSFGDIPGFALPGSYHLQSYFEARDGAGNATTAWVCPLGSYCRQDAGLALDLFIDGAPPQVWIDAPSENAVVSSLAAITGTASDHPETGWPTQLKRVLLELRRNSTGETLITADIPVSGSVAEWSHPVDEALLAHLSSYTIVVRAEDAMENMSAPAERTFTIDLCANSPASQKATTLSGIVRPPPLFPSGVATTCAVQVCSKRAAVDPNTGFYELPDVTPSELRLGPKVTCLDDGNQCPLPQPKHRICKCGICGRFNDATCRETLHRGLDIAFAERGVEPSFVDKLVFSATGGTVVFVGEIFPGDVNLHRSWGWVVLVRSMRPVNGSTAYVLYGHLVKESQRIQVGESVVAGQLQGSRHGVGIHGTETAS